MTGGGLRARVAGADVTVPVPGGGRVPYVNGRPTGDPEHLEFVASSAHKNHMQDRATGVYGPAEWTDRLADVCRI